MSTNRTKHEVGLRTKPRVQKTCAQRWTSSAATAFLGDRQTEFAKRDYGWSRQSSLSKSRPNKRSNQDPDWRPKNGYLHVLRSESK